MESEICWVVPNSIAVEFLIWNMSIFHVSIKPKERLLSSLIRNAFRVWWKIHILKWMCWHQLTMFTREFLEVTSLVRRSNQWPNRIKVWTHKVMVAVIPHFFIFFITVCGIHCRYWRRTSAKLDLRWPKTGVSNSIATATD